MHIILSRRDCSSDSMCLLLFSFYYERTLSSTDFNHTLIEFFYPGILISSYFIQCFNFYHLQLEKYQMMASNIFIQTLSRFKPQQFLCEIAQDSRKQLNINIFRSIQLKVDDILQKFQHLEKKYSKADCQIYRMEWKEDEKKVLMCFLLAFCQLFFKKISEITDNEWQSISKSFHNKSILLMKYEAKSIQKNCERVHWQVEQEQILYDCLRTQMNGKWADISRHIFFQSNGEFFKTPKQCREHWFNHLNKEVKRGDWEVEQDLIILESVLDYGHKWARIVDLLEGKRTEHMIKNRFHSLLTCSSKFTSEKCEMKNQSKLIKILINELAKNKKIAKQYSKPLPVNSKIVQMLLRKKTEQQIPSQQFQPNLNQTKSLINQQKDAQLQLNCENSPNKEEVSSKVENVNFEISFVQEKLKMMTPCMIYDSLCLPLHFFYGVNTPTVLNPQVLSATIIYPMCNNYNQMFQY